jgi:glutathione S-transferase
MYQLFYSPGSCSLVVHALLEELGVPFELKRLDLTKRDHHTDPYRSINPKMKVPALVGPDGVLTECAAILEYLCDRHAPGKLLPAAGTWQRAKAMERIATLASEVHPLFNRFFHEDDFADDAAARAAVKARGTEKLGAYFAQEDAALRGDYWSGGDTLAVEDLYFMVIVRWGRWLDPPATRMKHLEPFYTRMTQRPAVARAFASEGLKPFG